MPSHRNLLMTLFDNQTEIFIYNIYSFCYLWHKRPETTITDILISFRSQWNNWSVIKDNIRLQTLQKDIFYHKTEGT